MLEIVKVKPQTLKNYLKINLNKEIYEYYHEYFKINTGVDNIDILKFFNSIYEIASTFIFNCYELPYETNEFMIRQCNDYVEDELIKRAFLLEMAQNIIFDIAEQVVQDENGYNIIQNSYVVGNKNLWTYNGELNLLIEKASKKLKEIDPDLCYLSIIEVYFRDYCSIHDTELRFKQLQDYFYSITNNKISITEKKGKPILINGVKPNISERYKITNEILDIYKKINSKNISATEKHKLLAHIMGCSQQTARELFNGTQTKRTSIRDKVINPYLDTLK